MSTHSIIEHQETDIVAQWTVGWRMDLLLGRLGVQLVNGGHWRTTLVSWCYEVNGALQTRSVFSFTHSYHIFAATSQIPRFSASDITIIGHSHHDGAISCHPNAKVHHWCLAQLLSSQSTYIHCPLCPKDLWQPLDHSLPQFASPEFDVLFSVHQTKRLLLKLLCFTFLLLHHSNNDEKLYLAYSSVVVVFFTPSAFQYFHLRL